jgi:hypothetical protein
MSATNGLAVSLRARARLIGCAAVMVLAVSALFASSASAVNPPVTKTYVGLGDSLAFGYSQQIFNENYEKFLKAEQAEPEPANAYNHGYVNYYFGHLKPALEGWQMVNNGCPGETTDSFLGNGPVQTALSGAPFFATGESPCAYHKAGFPLHHEYGGVSQLENALGTIAAAAGAGKPVEVISLNIGANDELHAIAKCKAEVQAEYVAEGKSKYGSTPEEAVEHCIVAHVAELFGHILKNVDASLYAIRNGAAFGGVNYAGKIIIQGGYDPYGVVFALNEPINGGLFGLGTGKEILPNSNSLAGLLNVEEASNVAKFGACYANPQGKFNPENKYEPVRLKKWTNMANFKENLGKTYGQPSADGPDIHPTVEGYKVLKNVMVTACG